jgi:hypothetical protein
MRTGDIVASDPSGARNENALQPPLHTLKMLAETFLRTPDSAVLLAAYNPPRYYATRNKKMNRLNTPRIVQTEPILSKESLHIVAMECTDQILKIPTTKVHRFTIHHDSPYNMSLGYKQ